MPIRGKLENKAQSESQLATADASPPSGQLRCATVFHVTLANATLEQKGAISAFVLSSL